MCTVTFIAQRNGYCLGMNRDEELTRAIGTPPTKKKINGCTVLCPSEPSGGTWISLNDSGASLALINWYCVTKRVQLDSISRGEVVGTVSASDSPEVADARLHKLPLERINPFRLIGIFPASVEVIEWCWNLKHLVREKHRWTTQQWISSGFDEPAAQCVRGETFRHALQRTSNPRLNWLRRLHRSHTPQVGPFSTCMHRFDAATVSYTEITVSPPTAWMCYQAGAPCENSTGFPKSIRFRLNKSSALARKQTRNDG